MATETTSTSAKAWAPDVPGIAPTEAVPDALILATSTVAGQVEGDAPSVRVQYVDDDTAGFVPEGDPIPEGDPDLAEVLVFTGKVAKLVRLSREQWVQDNASGLLSESVRRVVTKAANAAYIAQAAPTPPAVTPPAGLLNVTGITDGGAIAANLDGLIDLQAAIGDLEGNPTHLVLSHSAWGSLRKFKDESTSERNLLGAGTEDTVPSLLNIPVLVSSAVPANTGLMIDRTAVVSAVGDVMVAQSEHAYFTSDSIGLRCTWRFGANLVHPERIGKFTVTPPA